MDNLINRLKDAALSFYITWLLYASTLGVFFVVLAWLVTLVGCFFGDARALLRFTGTLTLQWLRVFTPKGWKEKRDAR